MTADLPLKLPISTITPLRGAQAAIIPRNRASFSSKKPGMSFAACQASFRAASRPGGTRTGITIVHLYRAEDLPPHQCTLSRQMIAKGKMQKAATLACHSGSLLHAVGELERAGNGQAESLARLPEEVLCTERLHRLFPCVIACSARREEVAGDQLGRATLYLGAKENVIAVGPLIKAKGIVCVVDPDRRIQDRHDHRELATNRHARHCIGAEDGPNIALEPNLRSWNSALARSIVEHRASVKRSSDRCEAFRTLLQLTAIGHDIQAEVIE